jgi:SAM-dependent methyltransferase
MAHGRIVWSAAVPTSLARRVKLGAQDALDAVTGRRDPLVPPRHLQGSPPGGFVAAGDARVNLLVALAKLSQEQRVVEIGCGHGCVARALTAYLGPGAAYDGVDADPHAIAWCAEHYRNRIDFHFHHVERGSAIPLAAGEANLVVVADLLPRRTPEEVEHLLGESRRLLAGDGRLFATGFLLDDSAREAIAGGGAAVAFGASDGVRAPGPDETWAYEEEWLLDRIAQAGFRTAGIRHGTWTPRPTGRAHEDVVVARA